ncbi:MAG: BphX family protein [Pseudomonadota bacterium]|nr:BphX family protein [Pseudomonadota bacterium]
MRSPKAFMITIGVFYFLNLVALWPQLFAPLLPTMYPDVDLRQGEPVFQLVLDAWLAVGLGLAAVGAVLLWGARKPQHYVGLIPVVIMIEFLFALWDLYSGLVSYEALWMSIVTVVIHLLIIGWAIAVLRGTSQAPAA